MSNTLKPPYYIIALADLNAFVYAQTERTANIHEADLYTNRYAAYENARWFAKNNNTKVLLICVEEVPE